MIKLLSHWPLMLILAVLVFLPLGRSAELPILAGGLIALIYLLRGRLVFDRPHYLVVVLFACYWVPALVSSFSAIAPEKTWPTVFGLLRFLPFALFVGFTLRRVGDWPTVPIAVAAVIAVWLIDAWVQIITGYSLGGGAEQERLSGIFGARNLKLGPVLATLAPFFLFAMREHYGRVGLAVGFLALLFPILLAGSRASWLAYTLVCVVFAWRETRQVPRFIALTGLVSLCVAMSVWFAWHDFAGFDARIQRSLQALQGSVSAIDDASAGRISIWRTALRMIEAHPFSGVGVRGFRYAYPNYAAPTDRFVDPQNETGAAHAHQIVLEVLSETGIFGLACWIAGVVLALRAWWRAIPAARARAFAPALALVAMGFPLNTHLAFYSAWWGLLFWWLIALYCAALNAGMRHDDGA